MAITYIPKVHKTKVIGAIKYGYVTITRIDDTVGVADIPLTRHGDITTQEKAIEFIDSMKASLDSMALAQAENKTDYSAIEDTISDRLNGGV